MTLSLVQMLKQCRLFDGLNEKETEMILYAGASRMLSHGRHEVYTLAGDTCRYMDIVLKGELSARMVGVSGRSVEVLRLCRGDLVTPFYVFASDARQLVTIETETDVEMLRFSRQSMENMLDQDARIRCNYIRILSDMSCYLATRIYFLSLLTVKQKVIHYLRAEARAQQSRVVVLEHSRQRMAETFGIQKFSLLRCLSELTAQGVIQVNGRRVAILRPECLRV